jgi:HAD superfamily phosphatase
MPKDLLIFDMDGVLVDVTESFRETIRQTVEHFTGRQITFERIQDYKNKGGWNDDWALSHRLVRDTGIENVSYDEIVDYFQKIFHGDGTNGNILREKWVASNGLFDRLDSRFALAVFTGRLRWEANLTLNRFAPARFDPVVGVDDVARPKPAPDGLAKIRAMIDHEKVWYVGDTVDDARSAAAAKVPFIGIAAPANPRYDELVRLLRAENAIAVLDDINQIEEVLAT